ncbi:BZIP domain-containing protein [Mycena sanguinolenta]|uniref:BZIP domain-containing protein n=1 Tax=Mycena sanguinolenta TaxID=230812 RepID=A0A8H6XNK4_9AGAR|nr:BZIP domain-containing protein [Mycena sanguinolenta]
MATSPERSRNAKAQARHRAKRKAYIEEVRSSPTSFSSLEIPPTSRHPRFIIAYTYTLTYYNVVPQLEETVTKLQSALGQYNLEHTMTVLPPPLAKIRELEQENARLLKQNDELQRLLADSGHPSFPRRQACSTGPGGGGSNKRRKMDGGEEGVYISRPGSAHSHDPHAPPLTGPTYHDPNPGPSYSLPPPHPNHPTLPPPHGAHPTLPPPIPTHPHPAHGHPTLPPPHGHHPHPLSGGPPGALHLPDSPPRFESRENFEAREGDDDHQLTPVSAHPHSAHPDSHGHGHGHGHGGANGHGYTLPPFKFTALQSQHHNNDQHGSWRPYGESERGP